MRFSDILLWIFLSWICKAILTGSKKSSGVKDHWNKNEW